MNKLALAISAVTLMIGSPAFAADMAVKAPPKTIAPAPASSWTGFYIGGNAGYGWKDPTVNFSSNDPTINLALGLPPPIAFNISGAVGGFQLGYNLQFNQAWLAGIEADFDFSGIKGNGASVRGALAAPIDPLTQTANETVKWFGTVRGRLGYLPANNLLVYGTGGLAYGSVAQGGNYINNSGTGFAAAVVGGSSTCAANSVCYAGTSQRTTVGWAAGAGLEYALAVQWTARAEYLFVDLGSNNFNENALIPGGPSPFVTLHFSDTSFHVVRGGLSYKF